MPDQNVQFHAIVHGLVQGVGFRDTTQWRASDLGLTGWVRNRMDGTVETVAQGSRDILDQFIAFLHQGPPTAKVTQVDVTWQDVTETFDGFGVR